MSKYSSIFTICLLTLIILALGTDCYSQFERTWKTSILGGWNGRAGMIIKDIDNDGKDEIISNAVVPNSKLTNYWYILVGDNNSLEKEQIYVSDLNLYPSGQIAYTEHNNTRYLLEGLSMDFGSIAYPLQLNLIDIDLRKKVNELELDDVLVFFTHDFDKDSREDLIVLKPNQVEVYSIPNFELKDSFEGDNINYFYPKMLDLDSDGKEELIVTRRNSFAILELVDGKIVTKWNMSDYSHLGSYYDIDFYDFDDDGDIDIYMLIDEHFKIFDPVSMTQIAEIDMRDLSAEIFNEHIATNFVIGSIEEGGEDYIIYKSLSHLLFVDPHTLELVKALEDEYGSGWTRNLWDIWLGDTDGDGYNEAIWTNGKSDEVPPPTHLYIQDLKNTDRFWVSPAESLFLYDFKIAKSPDTGNKSLYLKQTTVLRDTPRAFYMTEFDLVNKTSSYSEHAVPLGTFEIVEVDGDDGSEILIDNRKSLGIYNLPNFELISKNVIITPGSGHFQNLEQRDIDLDGSTEIIGSINTTGVGGEGGSHLIVMNDSLEQKWHIPHIYENDNFVDQFHFEIGNVDDDPQLEIVVVITNYYRSFYRILVIDGLTREYSLIDLGEYPISGIELADLDDDGIMEGYIGVLNGVDVWSLDDQEIIRQHSFSSKIGYFPLIENIEFYDFDDNGKKECVITHDGMIKVINTQNFEELWISPFIGARLALNNSLVIEEIIDTPRIYVGTEFSIEEYTFTDFLVTSTNDLNNESLQIKVHPNPSADVFFVEFEEVHNSEYQYVIIGNGGQIIQRGSLNEVRNKIDLSNINSGFYFLQIVDDEKGSIFIERIVLINE